MINQLCCVCATLVACILTASSALFISPKTVTAQENCGTPEGILMQFPLSILWTPGSGMVDVRTDTIADTDDDFNEVEAVDCWTIPFASDLPEHVYTFTPPVDLALQVSAVGSELTDVVRLAVVSPCPTGVDFCMLTAVTSACTVFQQGVEYSIIVSGSVRNPLVSYTLTIQECQSCGDAILQPGEFCDEGLNTANCDNDCTAPECGDGLSNAAAGEQCDEGGADTENCDFDCTQPECGDGYLNRSAGEICDDGADTESCDSDCTLPECGDFHVNLQAGEACDTGGNSPICDSDCTLPECGDGIVNHSAGEVCDEGGNTETCDADCTAPVCGDGRVNRSAGEQCDEGKATADCNADCTKAECGDGIINTAADEECDDGNSSNSDYCLDDCSYAECGDGYLFERREQCDDGNAESVDGCNPECEIEPGYSCDGEPSECKTECGNGELDASEQCDDGNAESGDGCDKSCEIERGFRCDDEPSQCEGICGDGIRVGSEECDDGNDESNDGCDARCTIEKDRDRDADDDAGVDEADAGVDEADAGVSVELCGNGWLDQDEECDDRNSDDDDGCDSNCLIEPGWICDDEPSDCVQEVSSEQIDAGERYPDETPSRSGCGCSIPKTSTSSKKAILLLFALALVVVRRSRRIRSDW